MRCYRTRKESTLVHIGKICEEEAVSLLATDVMRESNRLQDNTDEDEYN